MRIRVLVVCASLLVAACGGSASDGSSRSTTVTTTTTASTATTTAPSTTTTSTAPGGTGTTKPETFEPTGDETLVPLLLEPTDFRPDLVYDDSSDDAPKKEFCDGVAFTLDWQAAASMSAKSPDATEFVGTAESILTFDPGDAAAFLGEFQRLNQECAAKGEGADVPLVPLEGFGDGGLRSAAPTGEADAAPIGVAIVRVGDAVLVLFSLSSTDLLTDALITKAVQKVQQGG